MVMILEASADAAKTIAKLNQAAHKFHLENTTNFFKQPSESETIEAIRELLSRDKTRAFVAFSGEEPVGYVLSWITERPENPFCVERKFVYIDQIAVKAEWQNQGVGHQLIEAVVDYAKECGIHEIEADTWAFNERSQGFFRSLGFHPRIIRQWRTIIDD